MLRWAVSAEDGEKWLWGVLTNVDQAEQFWKELRAIDVESGIRPPLQWLVCINNRDQLVNSELWNQLSDELKAWCIWIDESDIDALTSAVVSAVVARYEQDMP